jgi:SPOR domain
MNPTPIETQTVGESLPGHEEIEPSAVHGRGGIEPAGAPERQRYLLCERCQTPVDRDQRYCVSCGARQSHARNPATTYFAAAAHGRRTGIRQVQRDSASRSPLLALFLVLLPLGLAIGVLVGRSGSGSGNEKLIAALAKQQPVAAAPAAGISTSSEASATASGSLSSDFSLPRGFTIELSTLPAQGTDQAAVTKAEQEARAKGAGKVGLINAKDFKTTPSQGASNYLIYSGEFKTRAQATKALAKLRSHFPAAKVIEVSPVASAAATPVVAHTAYGTVHQVTGSRATPQQLQQDKQIVQKINHTVGKNYVNSQTNLPDVIPVPTGAGGGSGTGTSAVEKLGEH